MTPNQRLAATLTLAVLACPGPAPAQVPAGGVLRVNSYTTDRQVRPNVAVATGGAFVVSWLSYRDGSGYGVSGQRFDSVGGPRGSEFAVNTYTTLNQGLIVPPGLALDRAGNFVIAWPSRGDGSGYGAFGRRFDATGAAAGPEFQLNSYTTNHQAPYSVAMGSHGQFLVTWSDRRDDQHNQAFGRLFDSGGRPFGPEFELATVNPRQQFSIDAGRGADDEFVVSYSNQNSGAPNDVAFRRFDAAGAPLGGEVLVSVGTSIFGRSPVAVAPDGRFAVVWLQNAAVHAHLYDRAGQSMGPEFVVNDPTNYTFYPAIAMDGQGRFVVAWTDRANYQVLRRVMARRFNADGTPRGSQFLVSVSTTADQKGPALASDGVGNFIVTWAADGLDGSATGIALRRFGGLQPASLIMNDGGNGVLEPGESFTAPTAWRNVNGSAQAFQGGSSRATAPAGLALSIAGTAQYGTVPDGATGTCAASCFTGGLTGTRAAGHVDASFLESISPDAHGQAQLWLLHVGDSFTDVPRASPFYRSVETLLHRGVSAGCAPGSYCPGSTTTREQMAVFLLTASQGSGYRPTACITPVFGDVPAASPFCPFVEELVRRGVTAGCGGGNYCPHDAVTREQMSVFLLHTLDPALNPPACTTPVFGDVPASSPFCRWVEELVRRGITAGCGGGNYCPAQPVTREQMAAFLTGTFGLTLYGP